MLWFGYFLYKVRYLFLDYFAKCKNRRTQLNLLPLWRLNVIVLGHCVLLRNVIGDIMLVLRWKSKFYLFFLGWVWGTLVLDVIGALGETMCFIGFIEYLFAIFCVFASIWVVILEYFGWDLPPRRVYSMIGIDGGIIGQSVCYRFFFCVPIVAPAWEIFLSVRLEYF